MSLVVSIEVLEYPELFLHSSNILVTSSSKLILNELSGMSIKVVLFLTEKYKCDFVNRVFCVHIRA
jgi:hypothetical protein